MSTQGSSPVGLNDRQLSPVFPKTRNSLWDKTCTGQPVFLHLGYYRKPRICLSEKILKLVQHQCENYGQVSFVLIGSLVVDADGEGVQIQVDRLDTRTNVATTSLDLPVGSVVISLQVGNNVASERAASVEDYVLALKCLQKRCCSKDSIDLCGFLHLYGWASFYSSTHDTVAHLNFDLLAPCTRFKSTPITPVPVAVTALSKNLATPRNLSTLQGTPKTGYLTMDYTRKVMLVLESDPKCASLPIVGIWVSGVEFLHHPFVWAACLRYIHCTHLQDRACAPPEEFLLVLYKPVQTRPEFYQCTTNSGDSHLHFELSTGHEVVSIDKVLASPGSGDFVDVEMEPAQEGSKREIFEAAKAQHSAAMTGAGFGTHEDLEPRCAPLPHVDKVPVFRPQVPDVSVLWTESYQHGNGHQTIPGKGNSEFSLQQQQHTFVSGQHIPRHNHSQQVLHTRPPLSYQYSASRHHPDAHQYSSPRHHPNASVSNFQHSMPQQAPSPHPVNSSQSSVSSRASMPLVPTDHPQCTAPHEVVLPEWPHYSANAVSQNSQPIGSYNVSPSSSTNYNVIAGSSSVNTTQHGTKPASTYPSSHSLPSDVYHNNIHKSNMYNFHNINNKMTQHENNSISKEAEKPSCKSGIVSPLASTPVHSVNRHSVSLNPALDTSQHAHLPSSRDSQHYKTALKTISEETLLSPLPSSQNCMQHQGSTNVGTPDADNHWMPAETNFARLVGANNSVRSGTEDSGLDTTAGRLNISVPQHGPTSLSQSSPVTAPVCPCALASCLHQNPVENIPWDQVPPGVITLLIRLSEQVKQLQQQNQILQCQQIAQANKFLDPDVSRGQHQATVAVNTRILNDESFPSHSCKNCDCKSPQVTPARTVVRQQEPLSPVMCMLKDTPKTSLPAEVSQKQQGFHTEPTPCDQNICVASVEPSVQQHQSESPAGLQKGVSQREFDETIASCPSFNHTVNTCLSEPDCLSFHDRNQSDGSPSSTSDSSNRQVQEHSYSTVGEDAADPNQFLSQVMRNIQMFLTNAESQNSSPSPPALSETGKTWQVTPSKLENSVASNAAAEASSMSMLLGHGTDAWQSMEINALAMKYLSDEQLTKVAKLRQTGSSQFHGSAYSAKILEQVMGGYTSSIADSLLAPDISRLGMSSCDMTMGTLMYMTKHGMIRNDQSTMEMSVLGNELKLRTDFSMLTNGSAVAKNLSLATSSGESQFLQSHRDLARGDAAVVSSEFENDANDENWFPTRARTGAAHKDLGTSPNFLASCNYARDVLPGHRDTDQRDIHGYGNRRNILQEVVPQAFVHRGNRSSPHAGSQPEEEEQHLLDLEKLKQLPKLL